MFHWMKMLRRLIGEDITFAWLSGPGLWPVKTNPSQIDQILANLCVNAWDAITGVGKVTIETQMATFDKVYCDDHPGFVPGDFILLAVSDNSCGMDKEILRKLFEPFFTTKGVGQGSGLGLATVYGICKRKNGFDELAILNLNRTMLENLGYTILPASTPAKALRQAEVYADSIRLLLVDVVTPDMNVRELADQLRSLCLACKTLFMSGYTANVIAHHGILAEGVNFIQKPFSRQDLVFKVREVLEQDEKGEIEHHRYHVL